MKKLIVSVVSVLLARIAFCAVTAHLSLDCREGAKIADTTHPLIYDASWYAGGVTSKITANGQEIVSGAAGACAWAPSSDGVCLLTLSVYNDSDEVVGTEQVFCLSREDLTELVIPEGTMEISDYAFAGGLFTSVTIPSNVTSIGAGAFFDCSGLMSIAVDEENASYCSVDGVLYDKAKTELLCHPAGKIGCMAIPEGVSSIGVDAFSGCSGLTSVVIPEGVMSIGFMAFFGCDGLEKVYVSVGDLKRVKEMLVASCSGIDVDSLTFVEMLDDGGPYKETVNGIEWTFTIVDGEAMIGPGSWNSAAVSRETVGEIEIPTVLVGRLVTSIGYEAFYKCSGLTSVTIPEGVTSIGWDAFCGCSGLTSLTIPSSVTSIESGAFSGCSGLESVTIPACVTSLSTVFPDSYTKIKNVSICPGVTGIGEKAFYGCSGLTSVSIPSSVTSIGYGAFMDCKELMRVDITDLTAWCRIEFDYDYVWSGSANPLCYGGKLYLNGVEVIDLILPEEIRNVGAGSFTGCSGLKSVTMSGNVTNIGDGAFCGCSGLTSVIIPNRVTRIGAGAFCGCDGLTEVTIPNGVIVIEGDAFMRCEGLKVVRIAETVESIGGNAFRYCESLRAVYYYSMIPPAVGTHVYDDCPDSMISFINWSPSMDKWCERAWSLWDPQDGMCTVAFDAVGGACSTASKSLILGSALGLLPTPTRGNDVFDGWCTAIDGGTKVCESTVVSANMTLFAAWKQGGEDPVIPPDDPPEELVYTVRFNVQGGSAEWTEVKIREGEAVGELPGAEREGHEFLGWFTSAVGGSQVMAATVVTEDVTFYAQWRKIDETPIATYGPWGEAEAVKNPDKLGPTVLTDMTLVLNGAAGAVGDVVAVFRGDTGALCGLGKVMDESGTLTMACYAPTGVKLHFKVWIAASGIEDPIIADCNATSDLTAPTSGAFLSGHALVMSDDKGLTISLGSADWHTVSFNVLPEDPSPAAVFGSVKAKIAAVTQGIEFWMPGKSNSLKAIEIGKGYWVNTKVDDVEWTVSGKTDPKTEIALEEGWNLVGYAPETEGAVQAVLKTALAAKAIDYVTYGVEFYPGGTLKKMEPGKAYWVHAKKAYTLVYDDGTALKAVRTPLLRSVGAPVPTYGPWGESESVKNPDKLGPTFLTDVAVEIDGEPAEYGDVVAVFRGDTGALCGLGKVMDDSGTLTVVCYAPKGVTLSFKVWLSESGIEEAVVVKCDNASKLVAPDVGAFYEGHEISGSTAELIETIVPGEKVTIDTGLVGYTVSGLPKGLTYAKTTGKITGSVSKPTAAEGVVVKFTKKGFETEELTIVVTAIPKVTVRMEGVNSPGDTDGCKVTGTGAYLVGKKVTLKATAPKGTVFLGWFDDEGVVATQATYSFTMGKENVNLVAKFKKEVMSVGCETLSSKESFPAGVLGAEGGIKLDISTESGVKSVKVDKLPSGMKYDSKSGLITGAPTKAGDNKVIITVTAKSGAVAKKEIEVKVAAMPVMAVGTFTGFVSVGENNCGTFTLTTTDAGKLTAKVVTAAGTVSFSGTCWDAVEKGVYRATLTTKKGEKLTLTLDSTAAWDANQLSSTFTTAAIAATKKTAAVPSRTYSVSAQRNAFGKTWYFAATGDVATGWKFAYAGDAKGAALTVTLKADGSTSVAGKLPNGTDAKGKAVAVKVSASGYVNVGMMRDGAMQADFSPVLTIDKAKGALSNRTKLWFDRSNDHAEGAGEARFVK